VGGWAAFLFLKRVEVMNCARVAKEIGYVDASLGYTAGGRFQARRKCDEVDGVPDRRG
jgi:hypothetical protein